MDRADIYESIASSSSQLQTVEAITLGSEEYAPKPPLTTKSMLPVSWPGK